MYVPSFDLNRCAMRDVSLRGIIQYDLEIFKNEPRSMSK